jgi:hypothetical protein
LLGRRGWSILIEDTVLAVGIRKPPAVISVLYVTTSTMYIYAGGPLKPTASTDASAGGLLRQPLELIPLLARY